MQQEETLHIFLYRKEHSLQNLTGMLGKDFPSSDLRDENLKQKPAAKNFHVPIGNRQLSSRFCGGYQWREGIRGRRVRW